MTDSRLYSRLLLPKGHGYPLFHPQPFDDLPAESLRVGTDIGDVGMVTSDGSFDVIFNICRSADDPVNRFGVPQGFEQVDLGPGDIAPRMQYHRPGSDVSNTRISKRRLDVDVGVENNVFLPLGAGAVVEISTSSKEAAVLLLPDGASRTDLRRKKKFKDYALKHAQRWYTFVNGDLERMVDNGDLYLVTGTDKSFSWSVAAVENHSEDCKISLKLKAAQVGSAGTSCVWEWETANSFADSGPRPLPADGERTENQTVFLRGFKVAISSSPLKKAATAISIVDSKPADILSKTGGSPFSQSRPGGFFRSSAGSARGGAVDDEESIDASAEYFPANPKTYHPASAINEYLLNSSPTANVAVTHDDEWVSVLNENEEEFPDDCEFIRRIADKYTIDTFSDGVWLHDSSEQVSSPTALHDATCIVECDDVLDDGDIEAPVAGVSKEIIPLAASSMLRRTPQDMPRPPFTCAQLCAESQHRVSPPQQISPTPPILPARQSFISTRSSVAYSTPEDAPSAPEVGYWAQSPQVEVETSGIQPQTTRSVAAVAQPITGTASRIESIGSPVKIPPTAASGESSGVEVTAYTMPPRGQVPTQTVNMPPPPPKVLTPPPPPPIVAQAWGPFFDADMTPTPVFIQFVDAVFSYLDSGRTNSLAPEIYSRFLINQGYVGQTNIWNFNLVAAFGKTREEVADAALKRAYDLFGIQHSLRPRVRTPPPDVKTQLKSVGASFARAVTPSTPGSSMMPLLTRQGFIKITAIEALCDPGRHWGGLAHIVKMYDLPEVHGWGELPRSVLPEQPDPRMLARIMRVQGGAREPAHGKSRTGSVDARGAANAIQLVGSAAVYARNQIQKVNLQDAADAINLVDNVVYLSNLASNNS